MSLRQPQSQRSTLRATVSNASPLSRVLMLGVWVFAVSSIWAFSSPPYASPDEPAHTIRAVSLWSGSQLKGTVINEPTEFAVLTRAPQFFASAHSGPACWVFQPDVTANCATYPRQPNEIVDATTTAGLHPPFWYASIGWAGRLLPSLNGFYLMRMVSALLCAAVLAPLAATLRTPKNNPLELVAAVAGITPVALFLCGTINPNGFEICAAIATWASGLTAARYVAERERVPRLVAMHLTIATCALVLTRPLSPGFAIGILATIGLVTHVGPPQLVSLRGTRIGGATIGVSVAAAASWALYSGHLSIEILATPTPADTAFEAVFGALASYYQSAFGAFSWLDAGVSSVAVLSWIVILIALVGAAITAGARRWLTVLGAIAIIGHFAPAAAQYLGYDANGLVWQGRYSLPWLVGVPILAAASTQHRLDPQIVRRIAAIVGTAFVIGQFGGYYWAMKRWTVGATRNWWFLDSARWSPEGPFPLALLVVGFGLALAVGAWWLAMLATSDSPAETGTT